MPFTKEELEEMRRADEEIERGFRWTNEELRAARQRDRDAALDGMDARRRKAAEYQKAYREANREKVAEYRKAYYEANREKVAEYRKAYREANREKVAEYKKAYREANREKVAEYRKAYYEANREKLAEYRKAYREANREKVAERQKWIRDARKERGYTQAELARRIGTTQPEIALLESGRMRLDAFGKRKELCAVLGR